LLAGKIWELRFLTTHTQAALAECKAEQVLKRHCFVAKNHNGK
jgi:hypothetical protein